MPKKRTAVKSSQDETLEAPSAGPEQPQIVRANINREVLPAVNPVSIYANDTQLQISPWDFRFIFGVIAGMPSQERLTIRVQELGEVRMSPPHAKKVAQVLIQQIQTYEQTFGPIPKID